MDWHDGMVSLVDAEALTAWVNDYLASWSPYEIAGLPVECRPRRLRDVDDIEHWYQTLSESYCAGAALGPNADLYLKLLSFFSDATQRARELASGAPPQPGGETAPDTLA